MKKGLKSDRLLLVAGLFLGILFVYSFFSIKTADAIANNQTVNFQGRLLNAQGATVPDGFYNIEFKIYQDGDGQTAGDTTGSPSGSLKWTEDYLNSASHGVKLVNGYLSVNLGSITPFGSNINWNQGTLWLSMQIGDTSSCTISTSFQTNCGGDGEMVPMQPLTSSPYAQNAGLLGGLSSTQFLQLAQGLQTDASSSTNSVYINKTGTGNIIDLQSGGSDAFTVTNSGDLTFGSNTNHTLSVATAGSGTGNSLTIAAGSGASGGNNGGNLILRGGAATSPGTGGSVIVKPQTDSTTAFQVQNSSGNNVLSVDTSSNSTQGQVVLGKASTDNGALVFANSTNGNTLSLISGVTAGNDAITLPTAGATGTQCLQSSGGSTASTTSLQFGACGAAGTFLAKNATDTSSAGAGTGVLYAFTNSSSASTGGVISLDNGTNTGSTFSATTSGNPDASKAVIYGQNTNAAPSGNLLDLEAGSTPSSKFSVNASGDIINASNKINTDTLSSNTLTFGAASPASVQAAVSQALTITANASSIWSVGGTNQNLTIQTSGTGTLSLDTAGAGTVSVGAANATTFNVGTGTVNKTIHIGDNGTSGTSTITVGNTLSTSSLLLQSGTGNLSIQTQGTGTLGVGNNAAGQIIQIGNTTAGTTLAESTATSYTLNGIAATTYTIGAATTTGTITIGGTAETGTMTIGSSSATNTLNIASGAGATGATTVNIANNQTAGAVNIGAAMTTGTITIGGTGAQTGTISVGTGTGAQALNFGTGGTGAKTVTVGSQASSSSVTVDAGTGAINIGTSAGARSTNIATGGAVQTVTVGSTNSTSSLLLQSGTGNVQLATSGITRATFDTSNNVFFGIGITAAAPNSFTISGTGSSTTAVTGGAITLQGGNATVGTANGGNLTLSGGTGIGGGVNGLVVLTTPTYQTASTQTCSSNCTITQANIDSNGVVVINSTAIGVIVTMPSPTINTSGRVVYVTAANGSNDFTLRVNVSGAGDVAMRQNTTATMIWNSTTNAWTAAGASSSTTLQAAYDNTLTSAGGAELVVSNTSNHNGLTIRDSATSPVNGTLLEVQTATAAELFSVNGTVTDYANNGGSESTYGSEWAGFGTGGSVSRNTNSTYIANGTGSAGISTTGTTNTGAKNVLTSTLTANLQYNVSFAAKLTAGSASFTDLEVYYSKAGSATDVACTNYSTTTVPTSVWTKVNCTFTAPASGETSTNALLILGTAGATRTFYVDNVSVTVGASQNYATDGGVDNSGSFSTNWPALGTPTTSWDNTTGNDTSDSAKIITAASTNQGIKNVLSITPQNTTLYLISVYAKLSSGTFTNFSIGYSPDDGGVAGGNFKACVDYNTQTVTTTGFTQITCYVTTGSAATSAPRVYFYQPTGTARTFWVDTFSMTLASNAVPNVQIGGGTSGGPVTLLTLDSAASAPIAANNQSLLGSMYYDTTLGKLQCYESDGWGACGASPDNIVTLSPEYTNAVLHGPSGGTVGVGTMTSDFCSDALNINDGSSGQPTICNANETRNFYKWTSPQPTAQTYAIYVTYQLPQTFKSFTSGTTSLAGFTDSANSSVAYKVYDAKASGLTQCGSSVSVSSGVQTLWQTATATGAADPSTCGFAAGDSILFEIDVTASSNANAYVGNLNFRFSNQ